MEFCCSTAPIVFWTSEGLYRNWLPTLDSSLSSVETRQAICWWMANCPQSSLLPHEILKTCTLFLNGRAGSDSHVQPPSEFGPTTIPVCFPFCVFNKLLQPHMMSRHDKAR